MKSSALGTFYNSIVKKASQSYNHIYLRHTHRHKHTHIFYIVKIKSSPPNKTLSYHLSALLTSPEQAPHARSIRHRSDIRMRNGLILSKLGLARLIKMNKRPLVAHRITIIGCGEYSNRLPTMLHQISLILHLVTPHQQLQIIQF